MELTWAKENKAARTARRITDFETILQVLDLVDLPEDMAADLFDAVSAVITDNQLDSWNRFRFPEEKLCAD